MARDEPEVLRNLLVDARLLHAAPRATVGDEPHEKGAARGFGDQRPAAVAVARVVVSVWPVLLAEGSDLLFGLEEHEVLLAVLVRDREELDVEQDVG